jgi:hypothetical protein
MSFTLAVALLALPGCARPTEAPGSKTSPDPARPLPSPLPEVVARVNGQPVYLTQVLPLAKVALDKVAPSQREAQAPAAVRQAVQDYVDRELLLQEALARGIRADTHQVDRAYDEMHASHPDEASWQEFLAEQGMDARTLRTEVRIRETVLALLRKEVAEEKARTGREASADEVRARLVAKLRAGARIETYL